MECSNPRVSNDMNQLKDPSDFQSNLNSPFLGKRCVYDPSGNPNNRSLKYKLMTTSNDHQFYECYRKPCPSQANNPDFNPSNSGRWGCNSSDCSGPGNYSSHDCWFNNWDGVSADCTSNENGTCPEMDDLETTPQWWSSDGHAHKVVGKDWVNAPENSKAALNNANNCCATSDRRYWYRNKDQCLTAAYGKDGNSENVAPLCLPYMSRSFYDLENNKDTQENPSYTPYKCELDKDTSTSSGAVYTNCKKFN